MCLYIHSRLFINHVKIVIFVYNEIAISIYRRMFDENDAKSAWIFFSRTNSSFFWTCRQMKENDWCFRDHKKFAFCHMYHSSQQIRWMFFVTHVDEFDREHHVKQTRHCCEKSTASNVFKYSKKFVERSAIVCKWPKMLQTIDRWSKHVEQQK